MSKRYPDECPAFEYEGEVYEGRPLLGHSDECGPGLTLTDRCGLSVYVHVEHTAKPLTPAARELLAWCKGEL